MAQALALMSPKAKKTSIKMKHYLILILLLPLGLFSQTNPWENQGKVNPWGTNTPTAPAEPVAQPTNTVETVMIDTLQPDTLFRGQAIFMKTATEDAKKRYQAKENFALGFLSGLTLNGYGALIDMAYTFPNSKKEVKLVETIKADTAYASLDQVELEKRTKKALKNKKFLSAISGTIAGSFVQLGVLMGLYILN